MKLKSLTLIASLVTATAGTATAAEWLSWTNEAGTSQAIYTSSDMTPGILLTCSAQGKLGVLFDLGGGDIIANAQGRTLRKPRRYQVSMTLGERPTLTEDWIYIPRRKQIQPRRSSTVAKIYNAMIRGQQASIDISRKGTYNMEFPAINDAFRSFASTCPATQ